MDGDKKLTKMIIGICIGSVALPLLGINIISKSIETHIENKQQEICMLNQDGPWGSEGIWLSDNKDSYLICKRNSDFIGEVEVKAYFQKRNSWDKKDFTINNGGVRLYEDKCSNPKNEYIKTEFNKEDGSLTLKVYRTGINKTYTYRKISHKPKNGHFIAQLEEIHNNEYVFKRCENRGNLTTKINSCELTDTEINIGDCFDFHMENGILKGTLLKQIEFIPKERDC